MEEFLFGLEDKINNLIMKCNKILNSNEKIILKKLSIQPTFLFYGLPGTGKTSTAKLIYKKLKEKENIDFYTLNVDTLLSAEFGASSHNLDNFFENIYNETEKNNSWAYVIIDEIDSFAFSRYKTEHESIRRVLLTFNKIIDAIYEKEKKIILVAISNIWTDIDPAVSRRFYFKESFDMFLEKDKLKEFLKEFTQDIKIFDNILDEQIDNIYEVYKREKFTLGEIKKIIADCYLESDKDIVKKLENEKNINYIINLQMEDRNGR